MSDTEQTLDQTDDPIQALKPKVKKPGIIYLNYVPRYMTVKKVQEYFSEFGQVRRVFLKPEKPLKKGKPSKFFSEGWIEFTSRKVAKRIAEFLNNTQVGGKRHSPYYDALWNLRYLPKFQWSQLHERLNYQKAEAEQRMRAEIAQSKREINFYSKNAEKQKRQKKNKVNNESEEKKNTFVPLQLKIKDISSEENKSNNAKNQAIINNFF
ncbi:activator of basal transcription 1 [Caerostris darwini]|uniref:Activator of basal transcription 1 n=1 Tax=Caerostris darwini TaxID=1538125 RepID=A0AAV4S9W5_9ARAC|nr:activator of basal transcription 1 [Caerostris darwini]